MKLSTIKTRNLSKNIIKKIINLKKTHYKFTFKQQLAWFKNNIKQSDDHNILWNQGEVIGYNCLRQSKIIKNINRKEEIVNFLLFDTLLINKKYRNKKLSSFIMKKTNSIALKKKLFAFLVCDKMMVPFYKKYDWKVFPRKRIKFLKYHKFEDKKCMIKNLSKKEFSKVKFKMIWIK